MTTHEVEILEPVDLTESDGRTLAAQARGWSRRPGHRDTLRDGDGLNKRWDYWAILAGPHLLSVTIADLEAFTLADVWWADRTSGRSGGQGVLVGRAESPLASYPALVEEGEFALSIDERDGATILKARWVEPDGSPARLEVEIARPEGLESVNVVVPFTRDLFTFTSKQWARSARGELMRERDSWSLGADEEAWGVLDYGRGRWPHRIEWNWGGAVGTAGGQLVALQLGGRWTAGTGATENGLLVDGRLSKLGRELEWTYDWSHPLEPWRVVDPGGQLDATLLPTYDKHTDVQVSEDLGTEVHQVFGNWSGWLVDDAGRRVAFAGLQGFAEEARQRW